MSVRRAETGTRPQGVAHTTFPFEETAPFLSAAWFPYPYEIAPVIGGELGLTGPNAPEHRGKPASSTYILSQSVSATTIPSSMVMTLRSNS